jgi:transposase InsO family protein
MRELSRRPASSPERIERKVELELLEAKVARPYWGAKKLLAWKWPDGAPIALRTANRILFRNGLVGPPERSGEATARFERGTPNELWQIDFKGLKYPRLPYEALSVIDDCSRFCLGFLPVANQTVEAVWQALWTLFGRYGLPECILSDNGSAFHAQATPLPGALDARLWRLGVATTHGRPYHPQTQGKVERFHRTVQLELGSSLRQPTAEQAGPIYEEFRIRYNWERPHEALGMRPPGAVFTESSRRRPDELPEQEIPEGAISRKLDGWGNFGFKGTRYKVGRGLQGQRVVLRDGTTDHEVCYCGVVLGSLRDFEL